ncbi:thiamine phosphate synthase [Methylobacillus gramineus]|uniref:thiamine phosphate synthase n=1 Tax=Methylobacillus gramineus TaxID=755169 RepID=UPI001CFFF87D|nr:thiamine phosphate synthase [Methylobacillus gramineus]MCB5185781.1 thiamine phosphate synthase [Methylobacillus gramineus]
MTQSNPGQRIRGLYAITPDETDLIRLLKNTEVALTGGASVLQYRNKRVHGAAAKAQAQALLALCRRYQVPLIINDDIDLAAELDADGVHLGIDDGDITKARLRLGPGKIIGASCYNNLALAQQAKQLGADYVAFGACFPSTTKPDAPRADRTLFSQAATLGLPLTAIGGITLENADSIISAGAHAIAVIGALWNTTDIHATATQFTQLFTESSHE